MLNLRSVFAMLHLKNMKINKYNSLIVALLFGLSLSAQTQPKQWTLEELSLIHI